MNRKGLLLFAALCMQTAYAKDAQTLVNDFASIMPNGKKARAVWAQSSGSGTEIFGVDSDDGVVSQISSGGNNADWPCLTADGSRVFFYDNNSGEVKIVPFSGGTETTLQADYVSSGEVTIESWIDPSDGSDWVIIGQACGAKIGRIDIDNPTNCEPLWTSNDMPSPSHGDGLGLSLDGTHIIAMWEHDSPSYWSHGVGNVQNQTVETGPEWIGCGVSMPADNTYRVSFLADVIKVDDGDGVGVTELDAGNDVLSWTSNNSHQITCPGEDYFQVRNHRWTNDPDYLAISITASDANPFIYKLSSGEFICIKDNMGCDWSGHADVLFYDPSSAKSAPAHAAMKSGNSIRSAHSVYSLDGRKLTASALKNRTAQGIIVRSIQNQGTSKLQAVFAR